MAEKAPKFDDTDPAVEENEPGPTVDDKSIVPGCVVRYTTRLGIVQRATVTGLVVQDDGTTRADLDAEVDGRWQRFAGVLHNADGIINTWGYAPGEE